MTDSARMERALDDRAKLARVIRRRPKVGPFAAVLMSVVFALMAAPVAMFDSILVHSGAVSFDVDQPAPITVRVAQFAGYSDDRFDLSGGPVAIPRGQVLDATSADIARSVTARRPAGLQGFAVYFAGFFLLALMYTMQLRRSNRGRLVRTQVITLILLLLTAIIAKLALTFSSVSVLVLPIAAIAVVAAVVVDMTAGLTTAVLASFLFGLMVPFDLGVLAVLGVQSATIVLFIGERHKSRYILLAGLLSGAAAVLTYGVFYYLSTLTLPVHELADPLRSSLVAAAGGCLIAAVLALPAKPFYQFLLGDITRNKLVELEDLSNPLLKRIAQKAPGTWQHSMAMANMAEIAANAIGANGRLVRVGAYYHDLGKSLQSKYFIENLESGETSPHDQLPPEVSCDAIFAHVTEGIRLARKSGLPERIIDFMHMHHGDGLLEYFWAKCQESGNPNGLTEEDFRYPGVPPQSRETAILAIVDAVEAASRTLKKPDDQAVSKLVQRIVYGKLHLGQLDESGLSMADLRIISNSLRETIKHAHHGRIEYPWQREERERAARDGEDDGASADAEYEAASATQRIIAEPRLDSLDAPRPYWRDGRTSRRAERTRKRADERESEAMAVQKPAQEPREPAPSASQSMSAPRTREPATTSQLSASQSSDLGRVADALSSRVALGEPRLGEPAFVRSTKKASPPPSQPPAPVPSPEPAPLPPPDDRDEFVPMPSSDRLPLADYSPEASARFDENATIDAEDHNETVDFETNVPTVVADQLSPGATGQVRTQPPPPPGSPNRKKKSSTIELLKGPETRPEDDEGKLAPGTMVMGPPPATRPKPVAQEAGDSDRQSTVVSPVTIMPRRSSEKNRDS